MRRERQIAIARIEHQDERRLDRKQRQRDHAAAEDDSERIAPPAPATISVPVGQTIFLFGELSTGVASVLTTLDETGGDLDDEESEADDPLRVFIDPLTPGAGYVAASGFVYPTSISSVPEPGTISLLATGFALVMRRAASKNRRLSQLWWRFSGRDAGS